MKKFAKVIAILLVSVMLLSLAACKGAPAPTAPTPPSGSTAPSTGTPGTPAPPAQKKSLTIRIGSGHSESNPWVAALEEYFVKNVTERVDKETNYKIE